MPPASTDPFLSQKVGGLLVKAVLTNQHDPITWADVTLDDLIITVATDAIKASVEGHTLRLPVTYTEVVTICKHLGCIAPTVAISDAIFAQARVKIAPVPLQPGASMMTMQYCVLHNKNVDKAPLPEGALVADVGKDWILHERLVEKGAVNYGWRQGNSKPIQSIGGAHDQFHYDYSQVCRPVR